jgi:hypothetical protein
MRTLLILFVFISSISIGLAQSGVKKGPFHKNEKPWKKEKTTTRILSATQVKDIKNGLFLKNQKPFEKVELLKKAVIIDKKRKMVKGPKAKNVKRF